MEEVNITLPKEFEGKRTVVSGGNANFTIRVQLDVPYQGHTSVIVKHAEAFAKFSKDIALDLGRMKTEGEALKIMNGKVFEIEETGIKFRTPKLYVHDLENNNLIMEDLGQVQTMKEFVSEGKLKEDLVPLSSSLGKFISKLHNHFKGDEELQKLAKSNQWGKMIGIWREYGILQNNTILDEETKSKLKPVAEFMIKEMEDENEVVVMGDMWTGNLLIKSNEEGRVKEVYLVDWEVLRTCPIAIELAQLYAECFLLHFFKGADIKLANEMVKNYPNFVNDQKLQKMVAIHTGFHLLTWVPQVPWGNKQKTEECTKLGAQMAEKAWSGDSKWIRDFFQLE